MEQFPLVDDGQPHEVRVLIGCIQYLSQYNETEIWNTRELDRKDAL